MKADGLRSFIRFTMQKNELAEKIKLSVEDLNVPLWFPNLTGYLAETGWQSLGNEFGLTPTDYGTARILSVRVNTFLPGVLLNSDFNPIKIELLPEEITKYYSDSQIEFYNAAELSNSTVLECLLEAIELTKTISHLSESVFTLVKSLHLIKIGDDNYDISFSKPQIPFSIFVSVPKNRIKSDFLRVAEAIIHEAMHLQLSLIEKVVPVINSNEQEFYSPWKGEYRNSIGILHALYVFKVIGSFYENLRLKRCLPSVDLNFIKNRQNEISLQVKSINEFSRSTDLTTFGLLLTNRLMN